MSHSNVNSINVLSYMSISLLRLILQEKMRGVGVVVEVMPLRCDVLGTGGQRERLLVYRLLQRTVAKAYGIGDDAAVGDAVHAYHVILADMYAGLHEVEIAALLRKPRQGSVVEQ